MAIQTLSIVQNSLAAQQAALNVIGQNISNASTPSYTEQRPVLLPTDAVRDYSTTSAADGSKVDSVQRLWDARLAADANLQRGLEENATTTSSALEQVEGIVGNTSDGLPTMLTNMYNAWSTLASDGSDTGSRRNVVGTATTLADTLRDTVGQLQSMRQTMDDDLVQTVSDAKDDLQQVADLNAQIANNAGTVGANNAMTQRDQVLQDLANKVGAVSVMQPDGTAAVYVGGLVVVDGTKVVGMQTVADPTQAGMHQVSISGHLDPDGLSGDAGADLSVRDDYIPGYLQRLNDFASSVADSVNACHTAGYDLQGNAGEDFFTYDASSPAGTIEVNPDISADPTKVAASGVAATTADGTAASNIAALRYQAMGTTASGATTSMTPEQYIGDVVAEVGADVSSAQGTATTRQDLVNSMDSTYQGLYGVSVDQETVNLIQYQKAFEASAKIVQVVNEMMDSVLQITQ